MWNLRVVHAHSKRNNFVCLIKILADCKAADRKTREHLNQYWTSRMIFSVWKVVVALPRSNCPFPPAGWAHAREKAFTLFGWSVDVVCHLVRRLEDSTASLNVHFKILKKPQQNSTTSWTTKILSSTHACDIPTNPLPFPMILMKK